MSADPRYVDDGLAELVDRLELALAFAAWRPRYALGLYVSDGSRAPGYVLSAGELVDAVGREQARALLIPSTSQELHA